MYLHDGYLYRHMAVGESRGSPRQPWDVGRFAKTITFFNRPPSLQQLLQGLLVETPAWIINRVMSGNSGRIDKVPEKL